MALLMASFMMTKVPSDDIFSSSELIGDGFGYETGNYLLMMIRAELQDGTLKVRFNHQGKYPPPNGLLHLRIITPSREIHRSLPMVMGEVSLPI